MDERDFEVDPIETENVDTTGSNVEEEVVPTANDDTYYPEVGGNDLSLNESPLEVDETIDPELRKYCADIMKITDKYDKELTAFGQSDEERLDKMENSGLSNVRNNELNQSEDTLRFDGDTNLNDGPDGLDAAAVPARETVDLGGEAVQVNSTPVNLNSDILEEKYGDKEEDMTRGYSYEDEEEENVVGYDEVIDEVVEEGEVPTEENNNEEVIEEVNEEEKGDVDADVDPIEEVPEEEVIEEVVEENNEDEEGTCMGTVEETVVHGGHINDELTGELRQEVEAIELNNEANTQLFDNMEILSDVNANGAGAENSDGAEVGEAIGDVIAEGSESPEPTEEYATESRKENLIGSRLSLKGMAAFLGK